ncbi:MAG: malto-oligosyltrehalose trehalohydrolase, partial [Betaproteobacteria bacterium]
MAAQETLIRGHAMPFGAAMLAQGGVRFRLWAPAAKTVDVVIGSRARRMQSAPGGWYELIERDAGAGTLYQYRIDGGQLVPDPASR